MKLFTLKYSDVDPRAGTLWPQSLKAKRSTPNQFFSSKEEVANGFPEEWGWFYSDTIDKPHIYDMNLCCTNGLVFSQHAFAIIKNAFPAETEISHELIIDGITYFWIMPKLIDEKDINDTNLNIFMSGPLYKVYFSEHFLDLWNKNHLNSSSFIEIPKENDKPDAQLPSLKISRAKLEFKRFIKNKGYQFKGITPLDAVNVMMDFFVNIAAEGFKYRDDNMLLFQWDDIKWQGQDMYMLDITRQFTTYFIDEYNQECPIYTQLGMTFFFPINDSLRDIKGGNIWAFGANDIHRFRKYVLSNPALLELANRSDYADFTFERSEV